MKASDAVNGSSSAVAAGAGAAAAPTSPSSASAAADADANIERSLGRIDPDEILADEADPDVLLGRESDSESNFSQRNSVVSARSALSRPVTPKDSVAAAGGGVGAGAGEAGTTATSSSASSASSTLDAPGTPLATKHVPKMLNRSALASDAAGSSLDTPATPTAPTHQSAAPAAAASASSTTLTEPSAADTTAKLEAHILDLTAQVTGLNEKLVRSFERISDLEDDLSDAHARVSAYSVKVAELEKERQEHLAALNTGLLVEKAHVSSEMSKLMERVIEETAQRGKAESDKEKIERELDELSASLFNEANTMVAVERLARARAEEKSNNLQQSLKDTEAIMLEQRKILESLQAQLDERRAADEAAAAAVVNGAPTPGSAARSPSISLRELAPPRSITRAGSSGTINGAGDNAARQSAPLILTNTVPYHEFMAFVRFLRKQRQSLAPFYNYPLYPKGATGSGAEGSGESSSASSTQHVVATNPLMAGGLGLSHGLAGALGAASTSAHVSAGYSREPISPFAAAGLSRHRDYPTLPSNCESMVSISNQLSSIAFLKRAQEEDSEPALRLDLAPALSWLSRRSMQSSILEGTLVIEPVFPGSQLIDEQAIRLQNAHLPPAACAMCGTGVVNVPLPAPGGDASAQGGALGSTAQSGASGASSSSGWASSISAVTGGGRSKENASSSGSQGGSGTSSAGGPSGSGTLTSKSSLPSLFSSLRLGGSNRDKSSSSGTTIIENGDASEETSAPNTPSTPMQPAFLPVPTHIFRISETASQRYLLCPHHCLVRLRAVCAFWGYVRTLERSIVLEGKRPWEDVMSAAIALDVAKPAEEAAIAAPAPVPAPEAAEASVLDAEKSADNPEPTQAETEKPSETEKAAEVEEDKADVAASAVEKPANGAASTEAAAPEPEKAAEDATETAPGASDPAEPAADEPTTESKTAEPAVAPPAVDETKQLSATASSNATPDTSTPTSPRPIPPPLPARSTARRGVPPIPTSGADGGEAVTAATTPTASNGGLPPPVPPRTAVPMLVGSAALTAASASPADGVVPTAPSSARVAVHGGTLPLGWEERAWQEIVKLKEDMWKARVGVRDPVSLP
ncbi:hypothetical protein OC842_005400 [Tilletia horrida]|uniref:GDP/GTP exchange factor Sec2 N-terminal domain-containing protein n=1 Tax=Tilletia horrida TaxID=155126 RepID=A0AAN6JPD7_9BASI|nr:hypothetical protein OC842_005400 [Tilletia horrida]